MERGQFTFYRSYYEAIKQLKKADQAAVLMAICAYALDEEMPGLTGTPAAIFALIKPTLDASRRKAESGKAGGETKQTASKTEAKPKQSESKTEANRKQTAREKEEEREKEKEGENEIEKEDDSPPPTPFTGKLQVAFEDWVSYKKERRDPYKETGLKNLIGQIRNAADQYGDNAVEGIIRESMASGYKGIMFDRLKKQAVTTQRKKTFSELVAEMGGVET